MDKEKIKELFTKEIETLISEAELAIEETARAARLKAKYELLEKFDLFVKAINAKMNAILDSNGVDFKSQAELDAFMNFMRPTFDKMYEKYTNLGKDEN
jgi:ABC-type proline/glycine betaine transport system substrate-binding protein